MAFYDLKEKYKENIVAVDDTEMKVTYEELHKEADQLRVHLKSRSLVFSYCNNSIGSLLGYLAFLKNKTVPLLLNGEIDQTLSETLIKTYRPMYLFAPEERVDSFGDVEEVYRNFGFVLLKTKYTETKDMYPELGLLLTTSGSTGSPKLVRQSYENMQSNAEVIAEYLELDETEHPITTLPMSYTYGLSIINSHMEVGATMLMTKFSLAQGKFWKFFEKYEATSLAGVPYTYEILKKIKFMNNEYPSLRTMTQAGGKLNPELHKQFAKYAKEQGQKLVVMYGQTEATARMAYLPAEKSIEKYGSMGIAIPRGEFWLKDINGNRIEEANVEGELIYEGPNVTLGYALQEEDLALGDERHGVLETGDMAKRDEDGYHYIVGRKKRFLKVYGNRVNLDQLETLLRMEYENESWACAGVDDHVYVFFEGKEEMDTKELKTFLQTKTGLHRSVFTIKKIDEIPKNSAGKILYKKMEEYYDGV